MRVDGTTSMDDGDEVDSVPIRIFSGPTERARIDSVGRLSPIRTARITDEFFCGTTTSGDIGELGWQAVGSSPVVTIVAGEFWHPGIYRVTTPATLNAACGLCLGDNTNFQVDPTGAFDMMWCLALEQTTSLGLSFGLANPTNGNSVFPANGVYFNKGTGATIWSGRTESASSISTVNFSTQDTSFHTFRMRRNVAGSIAFSIDGGTEQTLSTNIPAVAMNPFITIQTLEAVAKSFKIDLFDLTIPLQR